MKYVKSDSLFCVRFFFKSGDSVIVIVILKSNFKFLNLNNLKFYITFKITENLI